jgi:hypothetical protein
MVDAQRQRRRLGYDQAGACGWALNEAAVAGYDQAGACGWALNEVAAAGTLSLRHAAAIGKLNLLDARWGFSGRLDARP